MSSRYLIGLWAIAVFAVWGGMSIASVHASTMPPPDQPEEAAIAVSGADRMRAPDQAPAASENADVMIDEQVESVEPTSAMGQPQTETRPPSDGVREDAAVIGEVVGHPAGKVLMSSPDVVTLRLIGTVEAAPGQRYALARRAQFVEHPESGRNMGYVVRVVGTVELEQSFGRYWTGRIISSRDFVTLDDWVMPFEYEPQTVSDVSRDLSGRIVAIQDALVLPGERSVVYTDLGADQGVKPGDEFAVVRPGAKGKRGGPDRLVGSLRILTVQAASSSASLTRTTEPVRIGDRVELSAAVPVQ